MWLGQSDPEGGGGEVRDWNPEPDHTAPGAMERTLAFPE